ncbi:hypothetical protein AL710_00200 [Clostridium botulinum]|uniref:hypothetical protein n=1 Tax=Clostridium botulinum TaxID=1491 RepID=UPI00099BE2FC|nr:hypothetical protein [Clostridium botulinum]OPD26425.1 hypothetical protein AL710_00200 [Clostridium botulinum]
MSARKILLIEPNYKNKYPPMGLMKIATYHKMLGDYVTFYKGEFKDFILNEIYNELLEKLLNNDSDINWNDYRNIIIEYIKRGLIANYDKLTALSDNVLVEENLKYYRNYYLKKLYVKNPKWDRICITTLFTFYWSKTIDTINNFKVLCKNINEVKVGGIAASLVPKELEKETGIKPHVGLLDKGGEYDDNNIIIDHLPLDYSILNEINYNYPENEGYYAYMTRGCVNKCAFCAVPKIEPKFNCFIGIKEQIAYINKRYGPKRNLLLLDNNVLASSKFDNIIDEIKECGFYKGATFKEPNKYEIAYSGLINGYNDSGYINRIVDLYKEIYKRCSEKQQEEIYTILYNRKLLIKDTATKAQIIDVDDYFRPLFRKFHHPRPKVRHVDFNQGIDARLINEHNIKRLAEIPIYPLRIAFDSWKLRDIYEKAIRLAAKNGIKNMSNYLLYNFEEPPVELYYRMKLNVELCDELGISIYSFPMKYHPIQDPKYFRNRTYIGKYWNRKFIRSIQAILNSTKGKVGKGKSFFEIAFGKNEKEFEKLLYMPEAMIIYRFFYKENGITEKWWNDFNSLSDKKLEKLKEVVKVNDFSNISDLTKDKEVLKVLEYYTISKDDTEKVIKSKLK